jgi:phosphatidylglycerol---prolipoprotein diacylglyceryl transferase
MHPILFQNRFLTIHAFAVCLLAGFAAVTLWAGFRARNAGLDPDICPALAFWVVPASLLGARLFSLLRYFLWLNERGPQASPVPWFDAVFNGGMIAFGGVIAGIAASIAFARLRGIDFLRYADVYAPTLGLGICIMRVGCFFAGCCWGKGSDAFLAASFPPGSQAGVYQRLSGFEGLFPSQLLGALDGLLIACILLLLEKRIRMPGGLFLGFILFYCAARIGEDLTRFYPRKDVVFFLTYNQWISVCVGACAILLLFRNSMRPYASQVRN